MCVPPLAMSLLWKSLSMSDLEQQRPFGCVKFWYCVCGFYHVILFILKKKAKYIFSKARSLKSNETKELGYDIKSKAWYEKNNNLISQRNVKKLYVLKMFWKVVKIILLYLSNFKHWNDLNFGKIGLRDLKASQFDKTRTFFITKEPKNPKPFSKISSCNQITWEFPYPINIKGNFFKESFNGEGLGEKVCISTSDEQ